MLFSVWLVACNCLYNSRLHKNCYIYHVIHALLLSRWLLYFINVIKHMVFAYKTKCRLLQCRLPSFTMRKTAFCSAVCRLLFDRCV